MRSFLVENGFVIENPTEITTPGKAVQFGDMVGVVVDDGSFVQIHGRATMPISNFTGSIGNKVYFDVNGDASDTGTELGFCIAIDEANGTIDVLI